jgi:hypothetical protein
MNHALARGFLPNWLARHFESYISIRHSYFSFSLLRMSCAMTYIPQMSGGISGQFPPGRGGSLGSLRRFEFDQVQGLSLPGPQ